MSTVEEALAATVMLLAESQAEVRSLRAQVAAMIEKKKRTTKASNASRTKAAGTHVKHVHNADITETHLHSIMHDNAPETQVVHVQNTCKTSQIHQGFAAALGEEGEETPLTGVSSPPLSPAAYAGNGNSATQAVPGRSTQWKQWDEAPRLAGLFKGRDGEALQEALDNVRLSGHTSADAAFDALCQFVVTSKNPAALALELFRRAGENVSWHTLTDIIWGAGTTGRPLFTALSDVLKSHPPDLPPRPAMRPEVASASTDWRAAMNGHPPQPTGV